MSIRFVSIIRAFSLSFSIFFLCISFCWGCDPGDRSALLAFSSALTNPAWSTMNGSTTDCCRWVGVRCAGVVSAVPYSSERVVGLELEDMMLSGYVSGSLGRLGQLKFLNLSGNNLSGPIPEKLFRPKSIQVIDLSRNFFSGPLTFAYGKLLGLNFLDVSANRLSGRISDSFHHLKRLEFFSARRNQFTGRLPVSLSSCSGLRVLLVGINKLSGPIDVNFTGLSKLEILDLGINSFTGHFPMTLLSCTNLSGFVLAENTFYGPIPRGFNLLPSLQSLYLSENNFSDIKRALLSVQACPNLVVLQLRGSFKGEKMPDKGIVGFRNLKVFDFSNCELSGAIPAWLSQSTALIMLGLAGNRLTGETPLFLTQLKSLTSEVEIKPYIVPVVGATWRHTYQWFITPLMDLSKNSLSGNR